MSDEINIDDVMTRRFELDEQIAAMQAQQKADLAPLVEELTLCENFVKAELIKSGAQQWKSATTGHQTFWTTKDSVTVRDMDAVIHYMLAGVPKPDWHTIPPLDDEAWQMIINQFHVHGMWGLLNKVVNKSAAKEIIEAKTTLPGVEYVSFRDLSWRRGKAA